MSPATAPLPSAVDVVVIGAGASGLMCAFTAGQRGRSVLVLDHANKVGKKILLSGGGRCNFTNLYLEAGNYLSENPHFCKSALKRYTPWDIQALAYSHNLEFHEKKSGQLFCDDNARDLLDILLDETQKANVEIRTHCSIEKISALHPGDATGFALQTSQGNVQTQSLVIATGGLSFPTMGASGFGYQVAEQFGHRLVTPRPALVPLTLSKEEKRHWAELSGVSAPVEVSCNGQSFLEDLLITHKGLSGPAILQISSYWRPGNPLQINWLPGQDALAWLQQTRHERPNTLLSNLLAEVLPRRLAGFIYSYWLAKHQRPLQELNAHQLETIAKQLNKTELMPAGDEGYAKAEVTLGGVSTSEISSKTLESQHQPGLYFIGEVLDITGQLGGFNFHWAWASGHVAGEVV